MPHRLGPGISALGFEFKQLWEVAALRLNIGIFSVSEGPYHCYAEAKTTLRVGFGGIEVFGHCFCRCRGLPNSVLNHSYSSECKLLVFPRQEIKPGWTHIHCFQVSADNLATWETARVIHLKYVSTGARPNEVFFNFKKTCYEGPGHMKTVNYKMTMPVLFEAINVALFKMLDCII